jgi:hypothetical protein
MMLPKYFICPMSKNIVDSVLELENPAFGLLPTRRQIDWNGGYVNGWNTESFYKYVKDINPNIILERDHSGPMQGAENDNGYITHTHDANYFDIIHLDPWKYTQNHILGIKETVDSIKYIHYLNPNVKFEILTEEAIKPFSDNELIDIMQYLIKNLSKEEYDSIVYIVIQSGVGLDLVNKVNTGIFDLNKLKIQSLLFKSFGKQIKEHNGDYLQTPELQIRFQNGLNSINIGPEIAQIETMTYLKHMTEIQIDEFYKICLDSKKWERWISDDFDFSDKKKLIEVCGHYCFNLYDMPKVDDIVKKNIKNKLKFLP